MTWETPVRTALSLRYLIRMRALVQVRVLRRRWLSPCWSGGVKVAVAMHNTCGPRRGLGVELMASELVERGAQERVAPVVRVAASRSTRPWSWATDSHCVMSGGVVSAATRSQYAMASAARPVARRHPTRTAAAAGGPNMIAASKRSVPRSMLGDCCCPLRSGRSWPDVARRSRAWKASPAHPSAIRAAARRPTGRPLVTARDRCEPQLGARRGTAEDASHLAAPPRSRGRIPR